MDEVKEAMEKEETVGNGEQIRMHKDSRAWREFVQEESIT